MKDIYVVFSGVISALLGPVFALIILNLLFYWAKIIHAQVGIINPDSSSIFYILLTIYNGLTILPEPCTNIFPRDIPFFSNRKGVCPELF